MITVDIYEKTAIINFMKKAGQISFDDFRMTTGHGGPRKGAGRPAGERPIVHHVKRPDIPPEGPAHVTLRVQKGVPSLRSKRFVSEFRRSLREVGERDDFRVVLYSIQRGRVARGSYPPRAPSDPDVRNSRIRLLEQAVRYER